MSIPRLTEFRRSRAGRAKLLPYLLGALSLGAAFRATPAHAYYGKSATEAELRFATEADLDLIDPGLPPEARDGEIAGVQAITTADCLQDPATADRVREAVDTQVQFLMGTFQSASFRAAVKAPGVLGDHYDVVFRKCEPGSEPGRLHVEYEFRGTVVFDQKVFRDAGADLAKIPLKLPRQPDRIYALGLAPATAGQAPFNLCTDTHYNTEGDFWYFWDPELNLGNPKECPIHALGNVVLRPSGHLKRMPNTTETYPEYDRLYGVNGEKGTLDVRVFIGYIEDILDPNLRPKADEGFASYHALLKKLQAAGFTRDARLSNFEITLDDRVLKGAGQGIANQEVFTKEVRSHDHPFTVRVQILVSDTQIGTRDETFHRAYLDALGAADLVVYDGHSGLGANLDLKSLAELEKEKKARGKFPGVQINADKYQIFFFNGCSSYPYYNGMYFDEKKSKADPHGTRNLDLVLSGLETSSSRTAANAWAFLENFLRAGESSWQKILDGIERSDTKSEGTYLAGVKGDEDNAWRPSTAQDSPSGVKSAASTTLGSPNRVTAPKKH